VVEADLFPPAPARADLLVANPPWVPEAAHGLLDRAVYDPGGALLARLVAGLRGRLAPGGEAWLVLSDLAERLGLRAEGDLPRLFAQGGLSVAFTLEGRPTHPRAGGGGGPLQRARGQEVTRLYGLAPA
jgi:methylase of polypeptide subunit release factors